MTVTLVATDNRAVQLLFTLPLVLWLPGYALTAALFPGHWPGTAERIAMSLGLSLVLAILGGLALEWAGLDLRAASWAVLLGNTALLASLVALVRRWRTPVIAESSSRAVLAPREAILLGAAALVVAGALLVAREGAARQRATAFTQLWVLPAGPADSGRVRLGVANHEQHETRYSLRVTAGGTAIESWPLITLGPGEQWEGSIALSSAPPAAPLEAMLYRLDVPEQAYRRVVFWPGERR
jgi:uncharacterized membrane protein